ncbi:DNA-binding transcriptional LysR family regulator [Herbaspirillum sp. Sphag1AN]|uniref:LysR family transcriptional regulator n=1 Tax=unclassified Herbaspirillum TaxID=2624150 RepID=UPI00161170D6|nr:MULTISPECIES: LysR family transcriptional regulator [unclassified Herbaspirillum]MBB3213455.1 DNA-binding transcriptional LysR family regulator [Herbaspirillum sp. Sphag1AN]MBB3246501.1 DNA-binding transcriptional LysR family regulator [Herbaspirillum sp. Sphag64]
MKIDAIDAFVAVVRCQSISLAAASLQLTQSAITRRIQSFEEALGIEVLDRSTKPPRPNAMGKRVYEQCRAVLREVESLRDLARQSDLPSGEFRLGVIQSVSDIALLDALHQISEDFPEMTTKVSTGWGAQLVDKVDNGELDAAIALFPATKVFPAGVGSTSLGRIELAVVAPKGELSRRSYKLADCHAHGWVLNPDGCGFRAGLQRALAGQGLSFKVNLEIFGADLQLGLVTSGRGLGLMPLPQLLASHYRDQLDIIHVTDFKPILDIWLIQQARLPNAQQQAATLFGTRVARTFSAAQGSVKGSAKAHPQT